MEETKRQQQPHHGGQSDGHSIYYTNSPIAPDTEARKKMARERKKLRQQQIVDLPQRGKNFRSQRGESKSPRKLCFTEVD